jgi:uncharacterized membrane protein
MKIRAVAPGRTGNRRDLLAALLLALIALLSLPGMAVSAYLTYGYFSESSLFCELGHGCDTVKESEYSAIFGVPVALLGVLMYIAIFATAVAGVWRPQSLRDLSSLGVFGMGLFGTLYSAYLTWLELYRIEAVCMWCTISALLLTGILLISVANLAVRAGSGPATARRRIGPRPATTGATAALPSADPHDVSSADLPPARR